MWLKFSRIRETPILWAIPFTLLIVTILTALVDWIIPFFNLNVELSTWLLIIATMVSAIITSVITEVFSNDKKKVLLSMLVSIFVFSYLYNDIVNVFMTGAVEVVKASMPHPLLGSAINSVMLTLVPGVFSGLLFGGVFSLIPKKVLLEKNKMAMPTSSISPRQLIFEKTCDRCGRPSPYDASYCPQCGDDLSQREVPLIKYCMFCGSKIDFLGRFCPDCGQGINQVDIKLKYQSFH